MKRRAVTVADREIPAELLNVDAEVWHDRAAHVTFMGRRGWPLDIRDRMGPGAPPRARRQLAVSAWAAEHGITRTPGGHPDYHQLRALGIWP